MWEQATLEAAAHSRRAVPNQQQLTKLWERVLEDSDQAAALLRPQALAAQLRDTRRVAVEWGLDLDHPAWHGEAGDNHEAFRLWNSAFETLCSKEGWLPPEDRPALLAQAAGETASHAGSILDLLGFDEINPAQASLLAAFENAGT